MRAGKKQGTGTGAINTGSGRAGHGYGAGMGGTGMCAPGKDSAQKRATCDARFECNAGARGV